MRSWLPETLFIDASKLGTLIDRVHRELTDVDLKKIVSTYHAWRGEKGAGQYEDIAGFCKSATNAQFAESAKMEQAIKANLRGLGYGG